MGMIGNLLRVTPKDLQLILKDSSLLEAKIYSEDGEALNNLLDLDKSWEGIFYLITGHGIAEVEDAKPPLSWTLFSGQIVDEGQDLGYGPAHYIDMDQVKQLNKELDKITTDQLKLKYNGKEMMEAGIYPEVWDESESLDYIMDYFQQLKEFYKAADKDNMAVITFIN
jgi:hypothetical protein